VGVRRVRLRDPSVAWATAAGVAAIAAVGGLVARGGHPDPLEHTFRPTRALVNQVRHAAPGHRTVLITGGDPVHGYDLQAAVAYALRSEGVRFLSSGLPGIGSVYDPTRHRHDAVIDDVTARPGGGGRGTGRVVARVLLSEISALTIPFGENRIVEVTLTLPSTAP